MSRYQVVAVYPSGRRFAVRDEHETFDRALWHLEACNRVWPDEPYRYAIDVTYRGADGQRHWRGDVTAPVEDCTV